MPADILDLIDGALANYAHGDDAMRWTPPESSPAPPAPPALPPERIDLDCIVLPSIDFRQFAAQMLRMAEVAAGLMRPFAALSATAAPFQAWDAAVENRLAAMHRDYRRRQKARRRRR